MVKFSTDPFVPPRDRLEPEGGWQEPCQLADHQWKLEVDGANGSFSLVCVDPCPEEKLMTYRPDGTLPGCDSSIGEYLLAEFGPFKLKSATDCPGQGWNDSGSHGSGCDCDHWVEPERAR